MVWLLCHQKLKNYKPNHHKWGAVWTLPFKLKEHRKWPERKAFKVTSCLCPRRAGMKAFTGLMSARSDPPSRGVPEGMYKDTVRGVAEQTGFAGFPDIPLDWTPCPPATILQAVGEQCINSA